MSRNLGLCVKCKEWYYNPALGYCHYCWAKKWFSWIVEPIKTIKNFLRVI